TAEKLQQIIPELKNKIEIVSLGATFSQTKAPVEFDRRLPSILFVGEIKRRKGVLELLQAGRIAIRNGKLSKIFIVGNIVDKSYYNSLIEFIETSQMSDHVSFEGIVSDKKLSRLYETCRASVLVSIE